MLLLRVLKGLITGGRYFPAGGAVSQHAELGGEHYLVVLERIFEQLKPRTYVEVGVFLGRSLRLAKPPTLAIGIDPEPRLPVPPAANHRVFAETSDEVFALPDLRAGFGGLPVDLAFIDGMHHFEYALR